MLFLKKIWSKFYHVGDENFDPTKTTKELVALMGKHDLNGLLLSKSSPSRSRDVKILEEKRM